MLAAYGVLLRAELFSLDHLDRWRKPGYHVTWQIVLAVVLLALGATVLLGAIAWCMIRGKSLQGTFNLGHGRISVGCR